MVVLLNNCENMLLRFLYMDLLLNDFSEYIPEILFNVIYKCFTVIELVPSPIADVFFDLVSECFPSLPDRVSFFHQFIHQAPAEHVFLFLTLSALPLIYTLVPLILFICFTYIPKLQMLNKIERM